MKDFVQIQSSKNIMVTCGLDNTDFTNKDSDIPDRLKISADWPRATVLLKNGQHWYPSEVAEWDTVKSLARDGIITIGAESDDKASESEVNKEDLKDKLESIKKRKSLDEVANNG